MENQELFDINNNYKRCLQKLFEQFTDNELITEILNQFHENDFFNRNFIEDLNLWFSLNLEDDSNNFNKINGYSISYIENYINQNKFSIMKAIEDSFYDAFLNKNMNEYFGSLLSKKKFTLKRMVFYPFESNGQVAYFLKTLSHIEFIDSIFHIEELPYYQNQIKFKHCIFVENLYIKNDFIKCNEDYLFDNCEFHSNILLNGTKEHILVINRKLFSWCTFHNTISLSYVKILSENFFDESLFVNDARLAINYSYIDSEINISLNETIIGFYSSIFKQQIHFRGEQELNIALNNSSFYESFNFENLNIKNLDLECSKFYSIFNISGSHIKNTKFKLTEFRSNFLLNNTTFTSKLDLSKSIIDSKPQFLHLNANIANRETARIIKDSFEQQNNIIEANKFYALEMKEREKELEEDKKNGKSLFEWLVFKIHGLASNHSQDWLLSLFWIFSFTFSFVIQHYINGYLLTNTLEYILVDIFIFLSFLYGSYLIIEHEKINKFWYVGIFYVIYGFFIKDWNLSVFSNQLNPFSIMTGNDDLTFSGLIYKVIIAYLIYQLIISIRQNTRRK